MIGHTMGAASALAAVACALAHHRTASSRRPSTTSRPTRSAASTACRTRPSRRRAAGRAEQRPRLRRQQRRRDLRPARARRRTRLRRRRSASSWSITGTGAVASVGGGVDEVFAALCAGRSGLAPLRGFDRDEATGPGTRTRSTTGRRPAPTCPAGPPRWLLRAVGRGARPTPGSATDLCGVPGARRHRAARAALGWSWAGATAAAFDTGRRCTSAPRCASASARRAPTPSPTPARPRCTPWRSARDLLAAGAADTVVVAGVDTLTESMYGLLDRVQPEPPDRVRPFDRGPARAC